MAAEAVGVGLSGCDILCTACAGERYYTQVLSCLTIFCFALTHNCLDKDDNDDNTGGGHIIRTLVFGLIANAFDVGSDLLNAFQYYRYLNLFC